ncbi:Hpt domain-containing protein [Cognatishimia sp. SS12]|uniref:Hpt domain-containing protein n=1 Tax=Cognatishimia sp. SS12 TaxID=2979465 RepID=UPI00232C15E0|nr:Hpt domain-containing protein [Cognatishimia sp. SS12]MDC0737720.1 Hpt domain-containing protein [Cognatishimia sp. SS12]
MIDWTRFEDLAAEVGPRRIGEIISIFWEEVDAAVAGLTEGPDPASTLHFITSCAANLGFQELARASQVAELDVQAGRPIDQATLMTCYRESRDAFLAEVGQHGSAPMLRSETVPKPHHS